MTKQVTIILKSPPSSTNRVSEALRFAVAMIGMDMMPNILFCCDGAYCLLRRGREKAEGYEDHLRALADLASIRVLSNSLRERGLKPNDLERSLAPRIISLEEASRLVSRSDIVFAL